MSQNSSIKYKKKKSAEEIQNDYFKKMSSRNKLKSTSNLIELCFKLNRLAQFYDAGRTTQRNS